MSTGFHSGRTGGASVVGDHMSQAQPNPQATVMMFGSLLVDRDVLKIAQDAPCACRPWVSRDSGSRRE